MNLRMKYTGKIALCGWGLSLLLTFAACSDEESNVTTQEGNATMTFRLSTRAEGDEATSTEQHTHLYVAERLSEHSGIDEDNPMGGTEIPLYCDKDFTIEGNSYSVTNLLGQWYKFAFVCVPDLEEVKGTDDEMGKRKMLFVSDKNEATNFNGYYVNYSPVLGYQEANLRKVSASDFDKDLSVYRKVIDRWAIANTILEEDVLLERITGQLVLIMGKPKDQFPKEVESIHVKLTNIPTQFYIHDNANGDILIKETGSSATRTIDAKWEFEPGEFDANEEIVITLNLLPYTFVNNAETGSGRIEDRISIIYTQGAASDSYPLQNDEGEPIQIKPNTRTIVRFNGMHPEEFEVRYAGFADGNDAVVGVDDDEWTGSKLD